LFFCVAEYVVGRRPGALRGHAGAALRAEFAPARRACFVVHAAFVGGGHKAFMPGGMYGGLFDQFYTTNTCRQADDLHGRAPFQTLDITPLMGEAYDEYVASV